MDNYGIAISALVLLAVVGLRRYLPLSTRRAAADLRTDIQLASSSTEQGGIAEFAEERLEFPPHGQVLALTRPPAGSALRQNAVFERLGKYGDGRMSFVGIVVDCGGADYRFSSADLGGVASAIAAWVRGWVAPCAIVITGDAAGHLQRMLEVTTLNTVEQLRIVDSVDAARAHVTFHLQRRAV